MVAPAPAASILSTRKAGNVETRRRAPALVSGRPCAGHGIGPILAPRTYSAAPTLAPGLRLAGAPHLGLVLTLLITPFGTKRANFGHSVKKVGVCNHVRHGIADEPLFVEPPERVPIVPFPRPGERIAFFGGGGEPEEG